MCTSHKTAVADSSNVFFKVTILVCPVSRNKEADTGRGVGISVRRTEKVSQPTATVGSTLASGSVRITSRPWTPFGQWNSLRFTDSVGATLVELLPECMGLLVWLDEYQHRPLNYQTWGGQAGTEEEVFESLQNIFYDGEMILSWCPFLLHNPQQSSSFLYEIAATIQKNK